MGASTNPQPMPAGNRLSAARQRRFVGRANEVTAFQSVLQAEALPYVVLYIFGPGGVGKTTLLRQLQQLCGQNSATAVYIDARNIEASPDALMTTLANALGQPGHTQPLQIIGERGTRHVLFIDTFELLVPLDGWLRDVFMPGTPENLLVVLAGREAPATGWRSDPVWNELMRVLPLRNLTPEESRTYLSQRNIPDNQHQAILNFTHGHPLALSLVADTFAQRQSMGEPFRPEDAPDVIKTLLEQFVQKVPGPAHRAALEACALTRVMTEAVLSVALDMPLVSELFEWLRGLSFIESNRLGLFPHDLLREALVADLRWRNPVWHAELHKRVRNFYKTRLAQTTGLEQQLVLFDYLFLHRDNMLIKQFFDWQETGTTLPQAMQPADIPALLEMVRRHEGEESVRYAEHWFARQPHNVLVVREPGRSNEPLGFLCTVEFNEASESDLKADPGTAAAWAYLQRTAPLRAGERCTMFRFWMARDSYQAVSSIQSLLGVNMTRHELTTPRLAFSFMPFADAEFWEMVAAYADLARVEEADFTVEGHRYGIYAHDWRTTPPAAWLDLLAEREIALLSLDRPAPPKPIVQMVALSEGDFAQAVRTALRDLTRAEALRSSPLLRSRLLSEMPASAPDTARAQTLRTQLLQAIESLQSSPREAKLYRAIYHTYVQPAATQEQAAEILDLPFSTYRRHLQSGILRLTEILWQRELGN